MQDFTYFCNQLRELVHVSSENSIEPMRPTTACLVSVLLLVGCVSTAERTQRREARAAQVAKAVAASRFTVAIRSMQTQRYGSRSVTSDFFLTLRGDTLVSYLPYLGRAYAVPPVSPPQGLNFTAPVERSPWQQLRHGMRRLELKASTDEDTYLYRIDISPDGSVSIGVRGQAHDYISFDGELDL